MRVQKKVFAPVTDTIKNTSGSLTKNLSESFIKNNQALGNLNNKLVEIMNDRALFATYLMCSLSKITNLEGSIQFKSMKVSSSSRVNDLLVKNTIPITLYNNLLTFRDTGREFQLKGDFWKRQLSKTIMLILLV